MDAEALREWYRYVDGLSRQPKRFRIDAEDERPWRPWLDEDESQPLNGIQGLTELPELSVELASHQLAEARVTASKSFEDPTLHDELPPAQEHALPKFSTPSFELSAPVFGESPATTGVTPEEPQQPDPFALQLAFSEDEPPRRDERPPRTVPARSRRRDASREELAERLKREIAPEPVDPTLTLEEAATLLGVCPTTVRRYTNRGQLPHFRTAGNQRRFRLSDVNSFMAGRTAEQREADDRESQ
jgi:excisionase family DNA binding protein